jgi:5,10-methylenetetrahydromethanopterin reductase
MDVSCSLPASPRTATLGALAERLGYRRVWCYDSPALYGDVWIALAQLAERTTTVGIGPAVLVPSLRHPMVTAAAIATVATLAPGRLDVAFGSGFTGRMALGERPLAWAKVEQYVRVVRTLLDGETATWGGAEIRMLHAEGTLAARPIKVPILIGADGPKGVAVAEAVGDGIISARIPVTGGRVGRRALVQFGTVLERGEELCTPRVYAAAGPGVLVAYHAAYELRGPDAARRLPGGDKWVAAIEALPASTRHLSVHDGHVTTPNTTDSTIRAESASLLRGHTLTGLPEEIRDRVAAFAAGGVTELAYQPAGDDLERELTAMARTLGLSGY